jgi:H2-forming N5,N10-methylenetetrahydromethanopterin dehydrogenase-like enzyme
VDEEGGVKIKSIPVETIEEIVVYLLSKIKEAVEVGSLDSLLRSMSFHFMNRSFLSDHLFLID